MGKTGPKNLPGATSPRVRTPSVRKSTPSVNTGAFRRQPPAKPPGGAGKVTDSGQNGVGNVRRSVAESKEGKRAMPSVPPAKFPKKI